MKAEDVEIGQNVWVKVERTAAEVLPSGDIIFDLGYIYKTHEVYPGLLALCKRLRDELKAAWSGSASGPCDGDDCDCIVCHAEAVLGPVEKEDKQ